MEIRNDLSRILPRQENIHRTSDAGPRQARPVSAQLVVSSSSLRDLANAMTLMQTASGIVQEALNVSSKLRSIAMVSMSTGLTDQNEIAQAIAGIKTSLQEYDRPVTVPSVQQSGGTSTYNLPDISGELDAMDSLARKGKIREEDISPIEKSLMSKQAGITGQLEKIGEQFGSKPAQNDNTHTYSELPRMIRSNFTEAFTAQGNVRTENVRSLL
jgi:hypothetical protein